jgi:hypothetical protein
LSIERRCPSPGLSDPPLMAVVFAGGFDNVDVTRTVFQIFSKLFNLRLATLSEAEHTLKLFRSDE